VSDNNPYLDAAVSAVISDNVSSSLTFLVQRAIKSKDAALCYADDLVRAAAASTQVEQDDAKRRLAAAFGKDFKIQDWRRMVRAAAAELVKAGPSRGLQETASGTIKGHLENAAIDLGTVLTLGFDTFASRVVLLKPSPWGDAGVWQDIDGVNAARWLHRRKIDVGEAIANRAAFSLAHENPFHPVRDYLTSLEWDHEPRLDSWMVKALGVADTCLHRIIAAAWTISLCKRIMEPGCKADYCIVLDGKQRQGKSTVLRALCNGHVEGKGGIQWFRDRIPKIGHKDFELMLQGVWLIELQELGAIRGAAWEDVKSVISSHTSILNRVPGLALMQAQGYTSPKSSGSSDTYFSVPLHMPQTAARGLGPVPSAPM